MILLSVVGARPQFIKAGPISRECLRQGVAEIMVHTGQHYDAEMSGQFFVELGLPVPRYNLEIGSASHAAQTGRMLEALGKVIEKEHPDAVLTYGDTNSTLAAALAAAKMNVPTIHVEAGLRSFNSAMPEEINRVVADHVCGLLLAPTKTACVNLRREGFAELVPDSDGRVPRRMIGFMQVGDVMKDALLDAAQRAENGHRRFSELQPKHYYLASLHRAANTDDPLRLDGWMQALMKSDLPVLLPLHPRTRKALEHAGQLEKLASPVQISEPLGYLTMVAALRGARAVLTDSGGLQKEAYLLGVPCITLREETEWIETLVGGWNQLCGEPSQLWPCVDRIPSLEERPLDTFGDGHAAEHAVRHIKNWV